MTGSPDDALSPLTAQEHILEIPGPLEPAQSPINWSGIGFGRPLLDQLLNEPGIVATSPMADRDPSGD